MPSVVVSGASRGIGYAFLEFYAAKKDLTVIGLARNKQATDEKLAKDGIKNVTIIQADMDDRKSLYKAADEVAKITGGSLDVLINNGARVSTGSSWKAVTDMDPQFLEDELNASFQTNCVGVAHSINAFLPLIRKGSLKKVITISTGMADDDVVCKWEVVPAAPYSISKAAVNTLMAKYHAALGNKEGILFLSISPGFVDTFEDKPISEEDMPLFNDMTAKFAKYAPQFTGPITPRQSVEMVNEVIMNAKIENVGGQMVSQHGDKNWL